ncbi:Alpha-ketoglutarate-dependent dioxygenase alkB 6-like [Homarus americanus]|uniref:Alpha-ketoglutarate-dependent dioxygenase alkB 6-like n=1 Tax=Homarus americanus TaxID=6706 RepID=A0A8J5J946_HOMAM|nr:Alpha-ketoglutarate-dependent dioxygenase alkB 6-like [Homarus americanus]
MTSFKEYRVYNLLLFIKLFAFSQWLQEQMDKITALGAFGDKKANHVLVNEYLPGQGIMPHVDGPMFYPTITTINVGSHSVLEFYTPLNSNEEMENNQNLSMRHIGSLLLEPRSLLIIQEDLYTTYLHGISQVTQDTVSQDMFNFEECKPKLGEVLTRETRISLTIRHVPKVLKTKLMLGRGR